MNSTVQKRIECSPVEIIFCKRFNNERFCRNIQNIDQPVKYIEKIIKLCFIQKYKIEKKSLNLEIKEINMKIKKEYTDFSMCDNLLVKRDIRNEQDNRYSGDQTIHNNLHDNSYKSDNKFCKPFIRNIKFIELYLLRGM